MFTSKPAQTALQVTRRKSSYGRVKRHTAEQAHKPCSCSPPCLERLFWTTRRQPVDNKLRWPLQQALHCNKHYKWPITEPASSSQFHCTVQRHSVLTTTAITCIRISQKGLKPGETMCNKMQQKLSQLCDQRQLLQWNVTSFVVTQWQVNEKGLPAHVSKSCISYQTCIINNMYRKKR